MCMSVSVSLIVTLSLVIVCAVLSLMTTCLVYTRRRYIRRLVCRSCPQLRSTCSYRQVTNFTAQSCFLLTLFVA